MSRDRNFLKFLPVLSLAGSFFSFSSLAANDNQLNPYIPHTYLNGYLGDGGVGNFIGRADILAPLYTTNTSDLFIYAQGFMGDKTYDSASNVWQLSAGAGYRQIFGSRIYGAYLFGDYVGTESNNEFWMISPGIESLGEIIDFRVNGYFPAGTDKWTKDSNPVLISHETNYDLYQYYTDIESVGPGGDAEIGAKLFSIDHMPFKLFLDGYAFYPEDIDHVLGIGGRVTFQPTRYLTLEARYTYDNENHNVFMGGIRLYLNGFAYGLENNHVDDIGIQPRLYDQIERNFAAGSVGTAAATSDVLVPHGNPQPSDYYTVYVINDNTEGTITTDSSDLSGDGTLENPYIYTSEEDMQGILDATAEKYNPDTTVVRIYYTSPSNDPFLMPTYNGNDETLSYVSPYSNQQLWGTTGDDWAIPSEPDTYAVSFVGGFSLDDVSGVEFHYLSIDNYNNAPPAPYGASTEISFGNPFPEAMKIANSQDIVLKSVKIGGHKYAEYTFGIAMSDGSSITLDDSKVYGNLDSEYEIYAGDGITVENGGDINAINNSLVYGARFGVEILPNSENNFIMGNFTGDGTSTFSGYYDGLYAFDYEEYEGVGASESKLEIGNISGVSFDADLYNSIDIQGQFDISIGDITNSNFAGVFFATDYSFEMGNIVGSEFNSYGGYSFKLYTGDAYIESIVDSTFAGTFYLSGPLVENTATLTIGSIEDSTFRKVWIQFYHDVALGNISNSSFTNLTGTAITIDNYQSLSVNGVSYTSNAQDFYNYLIDENNTFVSLPNKKVCLMQPGGYSLTCY